MRTGRLILVAAGFAAVTLMPARAVRAQRTAKPVLHGRHWVAITGKPLAATAGAMTFLSLAACLAGLAIGLARSWRPDVAHWMSVALLAALALVI